MSRVILILALFLCRTTFAQPWVHEHGTADDFPLAGKAGPAQVVFSPGDAAVVRLAAFDLVADVERITRQLPAIRQGRDGLNAAPAVLIGTLGKSELIDSLVAARKVSVEQLRFSWESFVITTVDHPLPGIARGLLIIGSDPRGTAYGVYELSQAIGVSPWTWWADVTPKKKAGLGPASRLSVSPRRAISACRS